MDWSQDSQDYADATYVFTVTICVSHVNTRLRYVLKSTQNSGSPTKGAIVEVTQSQSEYVVNAFTNLNALNGVYIMKDTVSGVDLAPENVKI